MKHSSTYVSSSSSSDSSPRNSYTNYGTVGKVRIMEPISSKVIPMFSFTDDQESVCFPKKSKDDFTKKVKKNCARSKRTSKRSAVDSELEIMTMWNDEDEYIINEILEQCKRLDSVKQKKKMDYFYGTFGLDTEEGPVMPMRFDQDEEGKASSHSEKEEFYHKKMNKNWLNIARTIISKDTDAFRTLVKSVNHIMYPQLKKFAQKILSPEFQRIMLFLKDFPKDESLD